MPDNLRRSVKTCKKLTNWEMLPNLAELNQDSRALIWTRSCPQSWPNKTSTRSQASLIGVVRSTERPRCGGANDLNRSWNVRQIFASCQPSFQFASDAVWQQIKNILNVIELQSELHRMQESQIQRDVRMIHLGDLYTESGQTLQSSFSAVSKPNFASKYALESSRRDLHNALLCTVLVESRLGEEID